MQPFSPGPFWLFPLDGVTHPGGLGLRGVSGLLPQVPGLLDVSAHAGHAHPVPCGPLPVPFLGMQLLLSPRHIFRSQQKEALSRKPSQIDPPTSRGGAEWSPSTSVGDWGRREAKGALALRFRWGGVLLINQEQRGGLKPLGTAGSSCRCGSHNSFLRYSSSPQPFKFPK